MDRRRFLLTSSAALAAGLVSPRLPSAEGPGLPAGAESAAVLDALPGMRPLIKRTFRPPNYEMPVALFREPYTPNDTFYVRWHLNVPDLDAREWRLRIGGPAASSTREFSLADLRRLPTREVVAVNQCSGNRRGLFSPHVPGVQWGYGAMGNATWRGVRLRDVLGAAGISASALEVAANGADAPPLSGPDFVKCLPMWKALDDDTLVAFEMNGLPLSRWHGAPARLVVPGWTATYWVKALTELLILDRPFDGFWMKTAYRVPKGLFGPSRFDSQDGDQSVPITDIRVNSLVVGPEPGATLPRGKAAELQGCAWDGGSGIRTVEVSLDDGRRWQPARLGHDLGRYAWRAFVYELQPNATGDLKLRVRATANDGSVQPDELIRNPAGYHHNVVQQVNYRVA
jgi:DMSO/TMAO reductase YedYZ molybdopterin-dependent catalytic subunit